MKLVFHSLLISPHHLSWAKKVADKMGAEFCFLYVTPLTEERRKLGWGEEGRVWIKFDDKGPECQKLLDEAEIVISGLREIDLYERRANAGKLTIYTSERWFKPIPKFGMLIPGCIRMLVPWYKRMVNRYVALLTSDKPFYYMPMSIWAARDMATMCGWRGNLTFESKAGGRIFADGKPLEKMRHFAYFVESTELGPSTAKKTLGIDIRKVLWVGRIIDVKRVGDIVKAVKQASELGAKLELRIYGHGADEGQVKALARGMDNVQFYDPVPIAQVRGIMRANDIYVLSSNAIEGWGAVINEALEEGIRAVGTFEAGCSSTLLPESCLYHCGDIKALAKLLMGEVQVLGIGEWSCGCAANMILKMVETGRFSD